MGKRDARIEARARRQARKPVYVDRRKRRSRVSNGFSGVIVKPFHRQATRESCLVVAPEDDRGAKVPPCGADRGDALNRVGPVTYRVAEAKKTVASPGLGGEYRLESVKGRVNVGNHEYFHRDFSILYS